MKVYSKNQLQRYPIYLKFFKELQEEGITEISSPKIAAELGYSEEQIRKDLQAISNEPGRPKKGRSVAKLIETLESFLGYRNSVNAALIGCGHLGSALLNYPNFDEMGLSIVAGFDVSPNKVGRDMGGKHIYHLDDFETVFPTLDAKIVVLCVPADIAQESLNLAVKNGATAIWNFAPCHLNAPTGIIVETVNLASSLAVLSHRLNSKK